MKFYAPMKKCIILSRKFNFWNQKNSNSKNPNYFWILMVFTQKNWFWNVYQTKWDWQNIWSSRNISSTNGEIFHEERTLHLFKKSFKIVELCLFKTFSPIFNSIKFCWVFWQLNKFHSLASIDFKKHKQISTWSLKYYKIFWEPWDYATCILWKEP